MRNYNRSWVGWRLACLPTFYLRNKQSPVCVNYQCICANQISTRTMKKLRLKICIQVLVIPNVTSVTYHLLKLRMYVLQLAIKYFLMRIRFHWRDLFSDKLQTMLYPCVIHCHSKLPMYSGCETFVIHVYKL